MINADGDNTLFYRYTLYISFKILDIFQHFHQLCSVKTAELGATSLGLFYSQLLIFGIWDNNSNNNDNNNNNNNNHNNNNN